MKHVHCFSFWLTGCSFWLTGVEQVLQEAAEHIVVTLQQAELERIARTRRELSGSYWHWSICHQCMYFRFYALRIFLGAMQLRSWALFFVVAFLSEMVSTGTGTQFPSASRYFTFIHPFVFWYNAWFASVQTVITSRYMLEYIIESRGKQLKSLNLATNILVKFDIVMQSVMVSWSSCDLGLHKANEFLL